MNDNLQELIEKLVYKTTEDNGWAPQNKLGQYLARMGRSVRELGYEKMSNFFLDHPDRYEVEKDEHGLPVVRLIGEAPEGAENINEIINNYQMQQPRGFQPMHQHQFNDFGRNNMHQGYGRRDYYPSYMNRPYNQGAYRDRQPQMGGFQRGTEQMSLFRWAFFPDREEWLQMLSDLSREHNWGYDNTDPDHPNTALFDYLRDTFRRLQLEGRVLENRAEGLAMFNTGLVDREEGRPIYAVFGPNPNRNRQPWLFQEFFLSSAPLLAATRMEAARHRQAEANDNFTDDDVYNIPPLDPGKDPAGYYGE